MKARSRSASRGSAWPPATQSDPHRRPSEDHRHAADGSDPRVIVGEELARARVVASITDQWWQQPVRGSLAIGVLEQLACADLDVGEKARVTALNSPVDELIALPLAQVGQLHAERVTRDDKHTLHELPVVRARDTSEVA
jgi:hypothetical protein